MILNHKQFDLYDKMIFERVEVPHRDRKKCFETYIQSGFEKVQETSTQPIV